MTRERRRRAREGKQGKGSKGREAREAGDLGKQGKEGKEGKDAGELRKHGKNILKIYLTRSKQRTLTVIEAREKPAAYRA